MIEESSDDGDGTDSVDSDSEGEEVDDHCEALKEAELSLNTMTVVARPSTVRMTVWIRKHEVSLLVDPSSSHNFINMRVARMVGLTRTAVESFDVWIVNRDKMQC